ncbi:hypothetical protein [Roseomonas rosulenta]|uniref:hypothetical protein n=1 Tax=Roseomonas rosulenta TaxID=2748667 RepID=UPI0018DF3BCA|nr:hypothetical protein [Roseomonas rosulenta]
MLRGMLDVLQHFADISIRRACGFAALGIGMVMLGLSYDAVLAFRSGAILTSIVLAVIWAFVLWSPRRDIRGTEMWSMLVHERRYLTRGPEAERVRAMAGQVLRDRLVWHGERIALAALALWAMTGLLMLLRAIFAA